MCIKNELMEQDAYVQYGDFKCLEFVKKFSGLRGELVR
jgi:hypothetical protein